MHREFVTKIEGHADLHVDWEGNKVFMEIVESERLFEGILVGRPVEEMAWITPRICGICSTAHTLASLKAAESALGLKLKPETILMRKLLLDCQIIQSHSVHLFYLVLPDYIGVDSGVDLAIKYPRYFNMVSDIKEVSDEIANTIGGRRLLPTTTKIDSPYDLPPAEKLESFKEKMLKLLPTIEATIKLFGSLEYPKFDFDMFYASQISDEKSYGVYGGKYIQVVDAAGKPMRQKLLAIGNYKEAIKEEVKNVPAKYGFVYTKPAMVGALARMAVQSSFIKDKKVKGLLKKYPLDFKNPFYNNLAQALEILLLANDAISIFDKLIEREKAFKSERVILTKGSGQRNGVGAIEAPRGGLYHEIMVDEKDIIMGANIITPTVQNLSSLEVTAQALLDQIISLSKNKRKHLLEMLVRAYDPCITCAVH